MEFRNLQEKLEINLICSIFYVFTFLCKQRSLETTKMPFKRPYMRSMRLFHKCQSSYTFLDRREQTEKNEKCLLCKRSLIATKLLPEGQIHFVFPKNMTIFFFLTENLNWSKLQAISTRQIVTIM